MDRLETLLNSLFDVDIYIYLYSSMDRLETGVNRSFGILNSKFIFQYG